MYVSMMLQRLRSAGKAFEDYRLESFKRKDVHPDVQLQ